MIKVNSSNPAFGKKIFDNYSRDTSATEVMTIQGTVNKIAMMLILVVAGAAYTWGKVFAAGDAVSGMAAVRGIMALGGIGGFVVALITVFNKQKAPILAPIYAILEGLFIGGLSAYFEAMMPGLVLRAVVLTFAVLFALLFAYKTRIIKVTEKFRAGVFAATAGIAVAYLMSIVLGMFGINMGFMHGGGTIGLLVSLGIVIVAALNLVLDFDFIEKGSQAGLPKYFEWYGAFGLMVTLIWLYIEILRLLAIFSRRS